MLSKGHHLTIGKLDFHFDCVILASFLRNFKDACVAVYTFVRQYTFTLLTHVRFWSRAWVRRGVIRDAPGRMERGEMSQPGALPSKPEQPLGRIQYVAKTTCFDVFAQCVQAKDEGALIELVSDSDKEFHFQNWFERRLEKLQFHFEDNGRNTYPDFSIVEITDGYEVKGLAWPGRDKSYDSNSQVPTGFHNGRQIFYVFGRYPARKKASKKSKQAPIVHPLQYPVVDLVLCHGDFLNADHDYVHKNKSVKGFGTYGDLMIRDRKMYVAPTPFALTEGTTGLMTLIVPESYKADDRFQVVGQLTRVESEELVVGYTFDLRTNELTSERVVNPNKGRAHRFTAYRLKSQADKPVSMVGYLPLLDDEDDEDSDE